MADSGNLALMITISATDKASAVLGFVAGSIKELASGNAMGALTVATVGAGAALAASVKSAGDFQEGLTKLVVSAGESKDNIKAVGDGILKLSTDTGIGTKQLTDGMYMIESAGFHGADGLKLLTTAAQGAKVGGADLAQTTDSLTTIMHDFQVPVKDSTGVMNSMIVTVGQGKMQMSDLNDAFTKVLPTAAKAGVSFTDVEGALATMSQSGDKGAIAGTHLNQMLLSLEKPSAAASKTLKEVGLTTDQVAAAMKQSLPGALQMITDAVGRKFPQGSAEYTAALATIVGGTKQMQAILELTGSSMNDFKKNTAAAASALKEGGTEVKGYDEVQQDLNTQLARVGAAFSALGIIIGQKLLPVITAIAKAVADGVTAFLSLIGGLTKTGEASDQTGKKISEAAQTFSVFQKVGDMLKAVFTDMQKLFQQIAAPIQAVAQLVGKQLKDAWNDFVKSIEPALPALKILAEVIGGALVAALLGMAYTLAGIVIAIAAVVKAFLLLMQGTMELLALMVKAADDIKGGWDNLPDFFDKLGKDIQKKLNDIGKFFSNLWDTIKKDAQSSWEAIKNFIDSAIKAVGKAIEDGLKAAASFAKSIWDGMKQVAATGWKNIVDTVNVYVRAIGDILQWLYDHNKYIKQLTDNIKQWFNDAAKNAQSTWDKFKTWWQQLWKNIQDIAKQGNDAYTTYTNKSHQALITFLQQAWTGVSKFFDQTWKDITGFFTQAWKNISDAVTKAVDAVVKYMSDGFDKALKTIQKWGQDAQKFMGDALNSIGNDISNFWSKTVQPALQQLKQQWDAFWQGVADGAKDVGQKIIKAIADGFKSGVNYLEQAVHNAISQALGFLGFTGIPGFATGVYDFQPPNGGAGGLAIVGENGPELVYLPRGASVIPQSGAPSSYYSGGASTSGGGAQYINIYLDSRILGKAVTQYQAGELRIQGVVRSR